MIECKFSLELTRNGVQKSIHAKAGEEDGRKAVITLTESGKVFDASTYKLRMFFDDETYSDKVELVNGCVEFVLPAALTSVAGERLCELKLSKGDRAAIYSPVFRVLVEGSLGADAEEEAKLIGSPVRYQEVIPALSEGASVFPDDEIAVYTPEDDLTTKRKVSSLPFSKKLENEAVLERIGANENGLTLDDEEISSDPIATTLQTLAAMIAADTALFRASVEPPDFASTDESFFYSILSSSVMNNEPGYYAPPSSGQLRYTDPTNNEEMLMPVIRGSVYKFSFDNATYQLQIRTLDSKDDVAELCKIVHWKYAETSEIPKNISQLENDRKFVSSGKVETMINEATAKIRELTEDEANNLTANTEARHVHENKSVLDNLGENEDGDLTYKGNPVSSGTADGSSAKPTPEVIAAQVVTIMLHNSILEMGGLVYGGVTSVDDANTAGKFFQSAIQQVVHPSAWGGSVLVFSPTDEGNVIYIDPMSSDEKTIPVQPGVVYIFYGTEDPYETTYTTATGIGIRELLINGVVL